MPEDLSNQSAGHCTHCGAALRANVQFCTACGAPVAAVPTSPAQPAKVSGSKRSLLWLAAGAAVLLLAVVVIFTMLERGQQPAPGSPVAIPIAPVASQDIPFPNVVRVSIENAHMMAMSGEAVIVDVRDQPFFDESRIRGALSLPLSNLPARYAELPADKAILTYCT